MADSVYMYMGPSIGPRMADSVLRESLCYIYIYVYIYTYTYTPTWGPSLKSPVMVKSTGHVARKGVFAMTLGL
jgi:hypothetical protein